MAARKIARPATQGRQAKMKHADVTITPVLNEHNEIQHVLLTIADVLPAEAKRRSEQKALLKILKNEKLLNEIQHITRIGAWELDLSKNTMTWSAMQREIHEVDPDYEPRYF